MMEFQYPEKKEELAAYVAENAISESRIWYDGNRVVIKDAEPIVVPESVSPRQFKRALLMSGLLDQVEAAIAAGGRMMQIGFDEATSFDRNNQEVIAMARGLGVSSEQLDQLFILASSL